jgi:hypothetical protein
VDLPYLRRENSAWRVAVESSPAQMSNVGRFDRPGSLCLIPITRHPEVIPGEKSQSGK